MTEISYEEAMADVQARVTASHSSFTAGMAILPKPRREAMFALYAFCREVDDIADEGLTEEARRRGLQEWRVRISNLFHNGIADHAITAALTPAIKDYRLAEVDFQDIIDGMEMDAGAPPFARPIGKNSIFIAIMSPAPLVASQCAFSATTANPPCALRIIWAAPCNSPIFCAICTKTPCANGSICRKNFWLNTTLSRACQWKSCMRLALIPVCRDLADAAREHFRGG